MGKNRCMDGSESERRLDTQSCPTLWDPMDCKLPARLFMEIFRQEITGMGCHFLLQEIFPTQGSNPGLPRCRQMLLPSELGKSVIGIRKVYLEINTEKKNLFKQS